MTTLVHLCVWSGDGTRARESVSRKYPASEISEIPHHRLRASGFVQRIRLLHSLRGRAIVFFFDSLLGFKHRQVLQCVQLVHRCWETVLCDESGNWEEFHTVGVFRSAPGALKSLFLDASSVLFWWCYLQARRRRCVPVDLKSDGDPTVAYLIPTPASMGTAGGAISHIRGFLHGLKSSGQTCRVFSGAALAQVSFRNEIVVAAIRPHFFWGAVMLSYNFIFARGVERYLDHCRPQFLYQRHCSFSIAGALLSRRLQVPLILEYNGSEEWVARHWDPNPLREWIKLCEDVTLRSAARIVVVSNVLRDDLVSRGIHADRIRVNPNAVDSDFFRPGKWRESGREDLGVGLSDVLIGFVGSFSLWHGIEVLQEAIASLLKSRQPCRLRFVLIGEGLLQREMRAALAGYEETGEAIFTGSVPREKVVEYLDACDILVAPHIPMPDGSRFFGSPTKLFEYMAMGKGIVASRLDQLAEVLEHDRNAVLVTPGDPEELAEAILRLALDPHKRVKLGVAARRAAVERHSWLTNVAHALSDQDCAERKVS